MTRVSEATQLGWAINAQRNWMRDHGSSEAGYIAYYGSRWPNSFTDIETEVKAIYAADRAYLVKLQSQA